MMLKKCVAGSPSSRKVWPGATVCGARITASRPRSWSSMAPQMLKRRAAQVSHACARVCGAVRLGTLATARARDMATPVVKRHLRDCSIDAPGVRENSDLYLRGSTYACRGPRGYCCRDGGGSFDKLRMRNIGSGICPGATKNEPHTELVEGRTVVLHQKDTPSCVDRGQAA